MNKSLRAGKSSELIVAGELLRHGLDVYLPCVDDQAIDLLIRNESEDSVTHYDIQVKSVKGYNRIIGVKKPGNKTNRYILIIHYRHGDKADEFFYLTKEQIALHHLANSSWGDLVFNRAERELYARQTLAELAERIRQNDL
jgi:hypothetical protein